MLKKLVKLISLHGITKVSCDLGYRSPSTISHWQVNGEIPKTAKQKVKEYLDGQKV